METNRSTELKQDMIFPAFEVTFWQSRAQYCQRLGAKIDEIIESQQQPVEQLTQLSGQLPSKLTAQASEHLFKLYESLNQLQALRNTIQDQNDIFDDLVVILEGYNQSISNKPE